LSVERPNDIWILVPSAEVVDWDGTTVIRDRRQGVILRLNRTAADVVRRLDGRRTVDDIVAGLAEVYEVEPEALGRDTRDLLRALQRGGLAGPTGESSPPPGPPRAGTQGPPDTPGGRAVGDHPAGDPADQPARLLNSAELELTYRCNQRCRHCFAPGPTGAAELETALLVDILGQLQRAGALRVNLTGGEVLLRPDVVDVARAGSDLGLSVTMVTNGTRMTSSLARGLAEAGVEEVEVSIHGATAETHDGFTRLAGSFTATMEGIGHIRAAGLRLSLIYVVGRHNWREYRQALFLMGSLTQNYGFSPLIYPTLAGGRGPLEYRVDDEQLAQLMRDGLYQPGGRECRAGTGAYRISPYGDVYPCPFVPRPVGDLRRRTLEEIWHDAACAAIREAPWRRPPPACQACPDLADCPRCPGLTRLEVGRYEAAHPEFCRIMRVWREVRREAEGGRDGTTVAG